MYPFRKLSVWEKAHALTLRAYAVTDGAVARRYPVLCSQLRRSIASIPANIAEGAGHSTDPQFNRFLEIALASAREADYHLLLAKDLSAISEKDYAILEARLSEVQGMLMGLRKRVLERIRDKRRPPNARLSPPPSVESAPKAVAVRQARISSEKRRDSEEEAER
jgi:four helix bundle protein